MTRDTMQEAIPMRRCVLQVIAHALHNANGVSPEVTLAFIHHELMAELPVGDALAFSDIVLFGREEVPQIEELERSNREGSSSP